LADGQLACSLGFMKTIAVIGTMDTKGEEHEYVAQSIRNRGHQVLLVDLGTGVSPQVPVDITRYQVAEAGGVDLQPLMDRGDRGECVVAMSKAAPVLLAQLVADGRIDGVISLGGGGGTALATAAMRELPVGFPKIMVSTLASGNTAHYVGVSDITMMPAIVDVAGLNSVSCGVFTRAVGAICGMVEVEMEVMHEKPLVVASMFGNTTDCVNYARVVLEEAGYEVLVFHATGVGGRTMEKLITSGNVQGVLDITTTEWADEITGATLSAGPTRLDAMSLMKVPTVLVAGCVDMANFGEMDSVPEQYSSRQLYVHNPQVTLMRTSVEENRKIGRVLAQKANANQGCVAILNPLKGVSAMDVEGGVFYDQEASEALFNEIHQVAEVEVIDYAEEVNSKVFATACADKLLQLMAR